MMKNDNKWDEENLTKDEILETTKKFKNLFGNDWADEVTNKMNFGNENYIEKKLLYIEKILPQINQYIFVNATLQDFENILRKTPPEKHKRLVKKESASFNLIDDFFIKFFTEMNIYIAPTTKLFQYIEMSKNSIKKARTNARDESKENKLRRKEIISLIFRPIQI